MNLKAPDLSIQDRLLVFPSRIKDKIHGSIPLTELECRIIDTPVFQRLRRIRQTAFTQFVFPGAVHSRFEHSIGTMHVAGLLFSHLIANQMKYLDSLPTLKERFQKNTLFSEEFEEFCQNMTATASAIPLFQDVYALQALRLTALLHDIGHGPLSHSCERFMASWDEFELYFNQEDHPVWLQNVFERKKSQNKGNRKIRHEIYSLLIIAQLNKKGFLSDVLAQDIAAIMDEDARPAKLPPSLATFFHSFVSGEIDADRIDYLLRDSHECGVVYGVFDLSRLLNSLSFYQKDNNYHICIKRSGIPSLEDYLRARASMYQQVYYHKTSSACEAMLDFAAAHCSSSLPIPLEEYLAWDDFNFVEKFKKLTGNQSEIFDDIFYKRRLWKRVYEESSLQDDTLNLCEKIVSFLTSKSINSTAILNSNLLTQILPDNSSFFVIAQKPDGTPVFESISKHSLLIRSIPQKYSIQRVFADCSKIKKEEIQRAITQEIIRPYLKEIIK